MQIDDTSAVFDTTLENQSCYRSEQVRDTFLKYLTNAGILTVLFLQENPIPNLVKLICDEDLVVVHQAAQMIFQLAKKETSNAAITNNPEVKIPLNVINIRLLKGN